MHVKNSEVVSEFTFPCVLFLFCKKTGVRLFIAMGKTKKNSKKTTKSSDKEMKYTADELLERVENYIDDYEFELALKFAERALALDPLNPNTLERMAGIHAELGNLSKARELFRKAVEQNPSEGHEKYLYLGQLLEGKEAVEYYLKGIEILKQTNVSVGEGASGSSGKNVDKPRLVSDAYCSLAEIFLTDCCFEENAEKTCEIYCQQALNSDPNNPEAYVVMANLLLSQENKEKAREMVVKSVNIWLPGGNDSEQENGFKMEEQKSKEGRESLPSYESRFNVSRILIEVEDYDRAIAVIDGLLEENDEDINLWYLLGWTKFLNKETENAKFFLTKTKKMYEKYCYDDKELLQHVNELLEQCGESLISATDSEHIGKYNDKDDPMETDWNLEIEIQPNSMTHSVSFVWRFCLAGWIMLQY